MAEYTSWTETTKRKVYSLPSGTNWVEVSKVLAGVENDLRALGYTTMYDDLVTVDVYGDEIHFSFEISNAKNA